MSGNRHVRLALAAVLLVPASAGAYELNGFHWEKANRPVKYYIHEDGCKDLGVAETFKVVQEAMSVWEKVGCSDFRWKYMGKTKVGAVLDKMNVILWEEKNWGYGKYAAAATSYGGTGDIAQGDIAFNGVYFTWKKGGGSLWKPYTVDPASVIVHEAGHLLGLSHTRDDQSATMAAAYLAGGTQKSLGLDDKLGLCKIYPADKPKDECKTDCDCPRDASCKYVSLVKSQLCVEFRDPIGAPCDAYKVNCPGHCVFYILDGLKKQAKGLCTIACKKEGDTCSNGWTCKKATTNLGFNQLICVGKKPKADAPPKHPYDCKKDAGVPDAGAKDAAVDPGTPDEDDGCSVNGRTSGGGWLLALLLLCLAARRRQ